MVCHFGDEREVVAAEAIGSLPCLAVLVEAAYGHAGNRKALYRSRRLLADTEPLGLQWEPVSRLAVSGISWPVFFAISVCFDFERQPGFLTASGHSQYRIPIPIQNCLLFCHAIKN